ncbi:MAG: PAS domain S-box protein [Methanobacteriaceae archaeon]|nr:PAS domain S-box protein [Methanobacteriaceae archaeon]
MGERSQIYEIEDLKPGDHLCSLFENDDDHKALLTPYIRFGLEKNEKVLYIVDAHTSEDVLDYLGNDGFDVDPYLESGQLVILTVNESYMKGGVFDPDSMISMLSEETEKALKEGYPALRVTGEMSWVLKGLPGSEHLIEYEAKLNEFFGSSKALAICQYDMRLFEPEILLNVLLTHPMVVIGTRIYENFYYMPPQEYPFDIPKSILKEWMKSLKVYNDANKFRKNLLSSMRDGLIVLDADGVHQDVNDAFCKMTGFSREELIGKGFPHIYWPEGEYENIQTAFENTLKGDNREFEFIFQRKNGEKFQVIVSPSIMKDDDGNISAVFATVKDISARKITENELKESHSKLEATLKAIPDLVFEVDAEGRIYDYYSPDIDDLYVPPDVFMGKKIREVLPKDAASKILQAIEKASRKGWHKGTIYSLDLPTGRKCFELSIARKEADSSGSELFVVVARDVTLHQKNEKTLKQARDYNRSLIEVSLDPLVTIGADGKITDVNRATENVTGYSRDELIGTDFSYYFTQPEKAREGYEKVFREGVVRDYPLWIQHKDGHTTPVIYNASVYHDENGEVLGVFAAARDITQLKKAEKQLSDSQSQLNSIMEGTPIPKFVIDKHHRIIYWNKALEELSRIDAKDMIGTRNHWKAFYDKKRPCMADLLVDGDLNNLKRWYKDKYNKSKFFKGAYEALDFFPAIGEGGKWIFFTAAPITDSEGNLIGAVETLEDVTEDKKAEIALKKSEERFRAVAESAVDAVVTTDVNGVIRFFNNSLTTIFGYSPRELKGKPLTILMPHRFRSTYLKQLDKFKKCGEHRLIGKTVVTTGLKRDGTEFPFEMSLSSWKSGKKIFFTSIIRDLTEKKKAEEKIKKQIILTTSINKVLQDSLKVKKDEEVALICIRAAEELTASQFGFIMEINRKGKADTMAVTDPGWAECGIPQDEARKLTSGMDITSYWGRVIKQGKSQIVNHPEYDLDSRGVPEGHPQINSFLGVPLKRGTSTIGLIGLANKEGGYDHEDLEQVETLAVAFIEALYNKRAEKKIEKSLKEKEMLLKEIHHRVKNNLSVISSLLNLQSDYIKDKDDLELFRETQTRAKSMALIHERLYQSRDLKRIDFSDYIKTLAHDLYRTYSVDPRRIELKMDLETVLLDINTSIPLGLILNELISNSMKYAFPDDKKGQISIKLQLENGDYILTVSDSGVGLPDELDFEKTDSLGLQLVNSLVGQIDGTIELDRTQGTKFIVKFQEQY